MKIKKFAFLFIVIFIFIFAGCSSKHTFNYGDLKINSVTVITIHGGNSKEDKVNEEKWSELIEDLNGLNYKSYSGNVKGTSSYQIVIKFSTGDEEIIDAYRIRRTENKPLKYQCSEAKFKEVVEKYISD